MGGGDGGGHGCFKGVGKEARVFLNFESHCVSVQGCHTLLRLPCREEKGLWGGDHKFQPPKHPVMGRVGPTGFLKATASVVNPYCSLLTTRWGREATRISALPLPHEHNYKQMAAIFFHLDRKWRRLANSLLLRFVANPTSRSHDGTPGGHVYVYFTIRKSAWFFFFFAWRSAPESNKLASWCDNKL